MEYARASTSSQRLVSTFDPLLETSEPDITSVALIRSESISGLIHVDIPVPVKELVHGSQGTRLRESTMPENGDHDLLLPHQELPVSKKYSEPPKRLDPSKVKREGEKDKDLAQRPKSVIR
ncbi:hypothetical protein O181_073452 [Austropuccinia psidii MF-1]|uniref:Uncharacterized protein n=1 Tax=Austropuccinia psidii MF-1 TaxID=1389203 RepID=A0A9Q3F922_9BASI|nr:hypothetical protein [Austropuccinia psidii MF-1]